MKIICIVVVIIYALLMLFSTIGYAKQNESSFTIILSDIIFGLPIVIALNMLSIMN